MKIKVPILKIQFYGFVGNVNVHLGLPWFCYRTSFDASSLNFRSKKQRFFSKNDFFDISINRPIWPIFMKKSQGKSCLPPLNPIPYYRPYLSHQFSPNTIFDITPPKTAILEKSIFDVFVKISRLWVKIRNFWVPKKTSDPHLYTLQI